VRPEQIFAEGECVLRCANDETKRYFSFTFRLPSLLDRRSFAAHTSDLMRAHYQQPMKSERKSAMSRTTASRPRRLGVRAALAALAIAAIAAAPVVAIAEATHLAKTTVTADPNDSDYYYWITGDGGAGGGGGGG
jgi:hypothetical protein